MREAFFMLQSGDVKRIEEFKQYSVFVFNPDISFDVLSKFRERYPKAGFLAYTNVCSGPSPKWASPYWKELRGVISRSIIPGASFWEDCPAYIFRDEFEVRKLARFHATVTLGGQQNSVGSLTQGLYIDYCTPILPYWRRTHLMNAGLTREEVERLAERYARLRQYYTACLRAAVPKLCLVGNLGGWKEQMVDPCLSGISTEIIGTELELVQGLALLGEASMWSWADDDGVFARRRLAVCIAWCRDEKQREVVEQLSSLPYLYVGTIRPKEVKDRDASCD